MARVKDLHLAKNMEDLDRHLAIPDVKTKKTQTLLESARSLHREAEKHYNEGDEEMAYVFYMRYFNLLRCINKKPDYSQYRQMARQLIGGNKTNTEIMDKLEVLSKSLTARYKQKESVQQQPAATLRRKEQSVAENMDLMRANAAPSPPDDDIDFDLNNTISCRELYALMKDNKVLVMDCRSIDDFENSHLKYSWAFNVPAEYIVAGISAGVLQGKLGKNDRAFWSARSVKDQVVLMDWSSADVNPTDETTIALLLTILKDWDPDVTYRSPIKILNGGYENFILVYPSCCTNANVRAPSDNTTNASLIDDIEYPCIHDITMKEEIRQRDYAAFSSNATAVTSVLSNRPNVDRTSKVAAIKTYDHKQKPILELAKEQEELLAKAEANDKKLDQASKKWAKFFKLKSSGVDNNNYTPDEQELLYNLMQLESTAEDYKSENNRLRDELERYKRMEREQQENRAAQELQTIQETTKQIETKIQERQRLDEQHEREREEREKQQATFSRDIKRHMKPPVIDEGISKPKIPQFDRAIKPTLPTNIHIVERLRDFSPVPGVTGRGLTGLKNLGNTCYMNSILQCLSNTPELVEYCVSNRYKKYISRSNKTGGHIAEEVAALIKVLWNGHYRCVASKDLRYVIGQYQQIFRGIEQQDSHEFLTILMDWLHSDLQTLTVTDKPRDNITASEKAWLEFTKAKESLILHLFYGQIKSTVKCTVCESESATYESFSNLSLELPSNGNMCQLSQCMDMYFSGEPIQGWNCPTCKEKRNAIKKLGVSKLPQVLVIHLKRFYADTDSIYNSYRKKQNYVRFPLDNLDMTPYIARLESRSGTSKTYQLYGVSNHYGSMESGHYTAFCKSSPYARWYKFDDQVVTPIDASNVVSSAAYILFYTRLNPLPNI